MLTKKVMPTTNRIDHYFTAVKKVKTDDVIANAVARRNEEYKKVSDAFNNKMDLINKANEDAARDAILAEVKQRDGELRLQSNENDDKVMIVIGGNVM